MSLVPVGALDSERSVRKTLFVGWAVEATSKSSGINLFFEAYRRRKLSKPEAKKRKCRYHSHIPIFHTAAVVDETQGAGWCTVTGSMRRAFKILS
jgi:hypothetical protein